jgi:proteasome alpha subunit
MSMPFYASAEQIMRDRAEYARKNLARGRAVVVLSYAGGILLVAENTSRSLRKISEIYDRIAFAAVGRYSEFENLRVAGVRIADTRGYLYDRLDVTGRALANAYAGALNSIFTDSQKPYEVELCVAEVGETPAEDQLYRLTFDGSVFDEPGYVVMGGGQVDAIAERVSKSHSRDLTLADALHVAVEGLGSVGGENGKPRELPSEQLEVAVLERSRATRKFRRVTGAALAGLLPAAAAETAETAELPAGDTAANGGAAGDEAGTDDPTANGPESNGSDPEAGAGE